MSTPSISAFFPCYGDESTIKDIVINADLTLKKLTKNYEIIVVNDASPDNSEKILNALRRKIPRLKIITHESNKGYGGAIISGIRNCTKDLIFYTDGDGQYNVQEIKKLILVLEPNVDVVNGYKIKRHDPQYRILLGGIYNFLTRLLFGIKIKDVNCDFRLMRKTATDKIELSSNSGLICIELIKKLQDSQAIIREVGVHHYRRVSGKSKFFKFSNIFELLTGIVGLWVELVVMRKHLRHRNE